MIVKFSKEIKESADFDEHVDRIRKLIPGGQLVRSPSRSGRALFDVASEANLEEVTKLVSGSQGVEYAEPDEMDHVT